MRRRRPLGLIRRMEGLRLRQPGMNPWDKYTVRVFFAIQCFLHPFLYAFSGQHLSCCPEKHINLVDDIGLEPMTFRTSSGCSSQLS